MNKGINDLIKLIEKETSKSGGRRRHNNYQNKRQNKSSSGKFSFQPKINKKSQRISDTMDEATPHERIQKGNLSP